MARARIKSGGPRRGKRRDRRLGMGSGRDRARARSQAKKGKRGS